MTFHIVVFLLSVCLLLSLALLWRLHWFPLRPSSSRGRAKRSRLRHLLRPRTPLDCPSCRQACTPSPSVRPTSAPGRPWREVKSRLGVLPHTVVDNSAISPTGLTVPSDSAYDE